MESHGMGMVPRGIGVTTHNKGGEWPVPLELNEQRLELKDLHREVRKKLGKRRTLKKPGSGSVMGQVKKHFENRIWNLKQKNTVGPLR